MASRFGIKNGGSERRSLLGPDDPDPVSVSNPAGASSFLLVGDHAGIACPSALGNLGVAPADWARHIACDIGSRALGEALAEQLDAIFLHQHYSRLVIDCNRDPAHQDAIAECSDGTAIPGNLALSPGSRRQRTSEIHTPYHAAIATELARYSDPAKPKILVSLHSFTPVWEGQPRPWHVGVLHGGGANRFALDLLARLTALLGHAVGENQPYRLDSTDYTVPRHAISFGLPYVELEIRQDRLSTPGGIAEWAELLANALAGAASQV